MDREEVSWVYSCLNSLIAFSLNRRTNTEMSKDVWCIRTNTPLAPLYLEHKLIHASQRSHHRLLSFMAYVFKFYSIISSQYPILSLFSSIALENKNPWQSSIWLARAKSKCSCCSTPSSMVEKPRAEESCVIALITACASDFRSTFSVKDLSIFTVSNTLLINRSKEALPVPKSSS